VEVDGYGSAGRFAPGLWENPAMIEPDAAMRLAVVGPTEVFRLSFRLPGQSYGLYATQRAQARTILDAIAQHHPGAEVGVTQITVSATHREIDPADL
jgi:hypothetical protein